MNAVTLMVVDDSMVFRNRITRLAGDARLGVKVVVQAENGLEAIHQARQHRPDLVTMDLTMPEMDGIECIRKIHALDPGVRILVVSALADKATAIEALEKGASGFLCKPFTERQLNDALVKLIEG